MKIRKQNFDQAVFEDSLFQALKNNQQTRHLINLRAQQIVIEISKNAWVIQLQQKLNQERLKYSLIEQKYSRLQSQLKKIKQNEEKNKQNIVLSLRTKNQKILNKFTRQIQIRDNQTQALQQQIQSLNNQIAYLKQQNETILLQFQEKQKQKSALDQQNRLKQQAMQNLSQKLQAAELQFDKLFKNHQQHMQKHFTKNKLNLRQIQQLKNQIELLKLTIMEQKENNQLNFQNKIAKDYLEKSQYQFKLSSLEKQLKRTNNQKQKIKKQLSQSQQNYALVKRQIGKFKDKYKKFEQDYNQMKLNNIQIQNQKDLQFQRQDKIIKQMSEKTKKLDNQIQEIKKKKIINQIKIMTFLKNHQYSLNNIRQENNILKRFVEQKVSSLKEFVASTVMRIINHISTELNEHFQQCILEIRKAREQKNLARQETKLKSQIIEHLDKLLNNEANSVYELRSELRLKKKQEQKLRKKLKIHYNQTEKKLQNFQKKYITILKEQY